MHPIIRGLLDIPQPPQRSEEWYMARHTRLTASDIATALGINPYETPDSLVLKKCNLGPRFTGNAATAHGSAWEDYVRDEFCRRYGFRCYEAGLLPHPTIEFLGGSPDGLLESLDGKTAALLEIKCPLRRRIKDEVPVYYVPQIQLLMDICDLEEAYFVEFVPEGTFTPEEFSVKRVARDREWFAQSLPVLKEFWERVVRTRADPEEGARLLGALREKEERAAQRPKRKRVFAEIRSECLLPPIDH